MKQLSLFFFLFLAVEFTSAQQIVKLCDGGVQSGVFLQAPSRSVENVNDGVLVTYTFDKATIMEDPLFEGRLMWKVVGFGVNDIPTQPAIPYRIDSYCVPVGHLAVVELVDSQFIDLPYSLSPARPPLSDSGGECYTLSNVPSISSYVGYFPTSVVGLNGVEFYRGQGIVNVLLSPLQYNEVLHVIRAYTSISYKVSFVEDANANRGSDNQLSIDNEDVFLANTTLNYPDQMNRSNPGTPVPPKVYLILSTPTFKTSVEKFAEWKRLLGFDVQMFFDNSWSYNSIKSALENVYNGNNLYYLLIVGDVEDVPSQNSSLINSHITDLPYACFDGSDDTTPDLLYGRISVKTNVEAEIVFDKIINYEKNPINNSSFFMTGLHCAYFQDSNLDTYADRRFAQTSEEIRNSIMAEGYNVSRVYKTASNVNPLFWNKDYYSFGEPIPDELKKPSFAWSGNAAQISTAINNGAFYVLHRDHGWTGGWGSPSYSISNINSLNNGDKLPVVFSMNCQTGKFNHNDDCFCEAFLKKENGGCVAIYGASELSYSGYNDALTEGMFDAIWPSNNLRPIFPGVNGNGGVTPTPTFELGQILNQGKARMAETYGTKNSSYSRYTKEIFHCFGDPSVKIYTDVPTSFSNVVLTRCEDSVLVSLNGDTATIVFHDLVDGTIFPIKGTTATYITNHPKNVTVCVSAHNRIPFISDGEPYIIYIQDETVVGPANYNAEVIKVGSNVTSTKQQGPVAFDGGSVTLKANTIVIDSGTTVEKGTEFKVVNN